MFQTYNDYSPIHLGKRAIPRDASADVERQPAPRTMMSL